jgi:predicted nucleic acid-binding protein
MIRVVDASVVVAALVDSGPDGTWAEAELGAGPLMAPHLLAVEVTSVLRKALLANVISSDVASLAYADFLDLAIELYPFEPLAPRVWELRATVTPYDAWYVALAEELRAPLVTLDKKLSRATGPRCSFRTRAAKRA